MKPRETVEEFLAKGGQVTKLPSRGTPRKNPSVRAKGTRPTSRALADKAEAKAFRAMRTV